MTVLSAIVASRPHACEFHLVSNGLSSDRREKLESMIRREGAEAHWYAIDTEIFEQGGVSGHVSHATYYRIGLPDLLPERVERLLYLDSDVLVVKSLSPLMTLPMNGRTIAAIQDGGIKSADYLGLTEQDGYFNAGVLLIDVRRWREQGIAARVRERIQQNLPAVWADQCHLNAVLAGDWVRLPGHWNYQAHRLPKGTILSRETLSEEACEALTNPSIIHFCTGDKPWLLECQHPYRGIYEKSRRNTPWANVRAPRRTLKKELLFLRNLVKYPRRFPIEL